MRGLLLIVFFAAVMWGDAPRVVLMQELVRLGVRVEEVEGVWLRRYLLEL